MILIACLDTSRIIFVFLYSGERERQSLSP
jgi:hypothetical protein